MEHMHNGEPSVPKYNMKRTKHVSLELLSPICMLLLVALVKRTYVHVHAAPFWNSFSSAKQTTALENMEHSQDARVHPGLANEC